MSKEQFEPEELTEEEWAAFGEWRKWQDELPECIDCLICEQNEEPPF
jgi:hypothetical protein